MKINEILSKREDVSQFLIHLTRDTKDWDGMTAEENLLSILSDETIYAYKHHCLFTPYLNNLEDKFQSKFKTVCFTETPLNKISYLYNIDDRQIKLKPYGLVFLKETIIQEGGNPCFYTNGKENNQLENYLKLQYKQSKKNNFNDDFYKIGAITNTFKANHDFLWEREWRIYGNFNIEPTIVFAIISENEEIAVPEQYRYIPIINPKWNYEEIVYQLSLQLWRNK